LKFCIDSRRDGARSVKPKYSATDFADLLHFKCRSRPRPDGTGTGTESCCFSHPAATGSIDRGRKGWLQQTPAHSRNRIRKWRCLSLSRRAACDLSRPYVGRVKGTILRLQHQGALSIHSDSTAAKATSSRDKSFGLTRIIREEILYLCLFACLAIASCEGTGSFVVKNRWRFKFAEARQRFRFTPTKRVATFILLFVVLGLATKCYRDSHLSSTPPTSKIEQASS
jgi:hypothetical protein